MKIYVDEMQDKADELCILDERLKEKDEEISKLKDDLILSSEMHQRNIGEFISLTTKQVCRKIREKCSASLMYSTSPILPEYNAYIVPVELLDQIERGEEC